MLLMIKIELSRALRSKAFLLAIAIGSIITIVHFSKYGLHASNYILLGKGDYPLSAYQQWLGVTPISIETYLFYLIAPIIAAMPFADSFFTDKKSGYIKNVFIRTKKSCYYIAKYIATFISGGLAIATPLILSFLLTVLFIPTVIPDISSGTNTIVNLSMWDGLYYKFPLLYTALYIAIDFVFYGLIATIALSISDKIENKFVCLFSPFLYYIVTSFLIRSLNLSIYDPSIFLLPYQPLFNLKISIIVFEMMILLAITFGGFYIKGVRNDTY